MDEIDYIKFYMGNKHNKQIQKMKYKLQKLFSRYMTKD